MGELVYISDRRADCSRGSAHRSAFFFALGSPLSYLVSERVERAFGALPWLPVLVDAANDGFEQAAEHARLLEIPLVRPHGFPSAGVAAARAAVYAGDLGCGSSFALSLSRLAFCGGFNIDDRGAIRRAAEASGIDPEDTLAAAGDPRLDTRLSATAIGLRRRGVSSGPALRIGSRWFSGLYLVEDAINYALRTAAYGGEPLTTV